MIKGGIYEVLAPNGVNIKMVALELVATENNTLVYVCYGQNRLFTYLVDSLGSEHYNYRFGVIISDYCVIPGLDELLLDI